MGIDVLLETEMQVQWKGLVETHWTKQRCIFGKKPSWQCGKNKTMDILIAAKPHDFPQAWAMHLTAQLWGFAASGRSIAFFFSNSSGWHFSKNTVFACSFITVICLCLTHIWNTGSGSVPICLCDVSFWQPISQAWVCIFGNSCVRGGVGVDVALPLQVADDVETRWKDKVHSLGIFVTKQWPHWPMTHVILRSLERVCHWQRA